MLRFFVLFALLLLSTSPGLAADDEGAYEETAECGPKVAAGVYRRAIAKLHSFLATGKAIPAANAHQQLVELGNYAPLVLERTRAEMRAHTRAMLSVGAKGMAPLFRELDGQLAREGAVLSNILDDLLPNAGNPVRAAHDVHDLRWIEYDNTRTEIAQRHYIYLSQQNAVALWHALADPQFPRIVDGLKLDKRSLSRHYRALVPIFPTGPEFIEHFATGRNSATLVRDLASSDREKNIRARRFLSQVLYFLDDTWKFGPRNQRRSAQLALGLANSGYFRSPLRPLAGDFMPGHPVANLVDSTHSQTRDAWKEGVLKLLDHEVAVERRAKLRTFFLQTLNDPTLFEHMDALWELPRAVNSRDLNFARALPQNSLELLMYRLCLDQGFQRGLDQNYQRGFNVELLRELVKQFDGLVFHIRDVEGRRLYDSALERGMDEQAAILKTVLGLP